MNLKTYATIMKFFGILLLIYILSTSEVSRISSLAISWVALSFISTGVLIQIKNHLLILNTQPQLKL